MPVYFVFLFFLVGYTVGVKSVDINIITMRIIIEIVCLSSYRSPALTYLWYKSFTENMENYCGARVEEDKRALSELGDSMCSMLFDV